MKKKAKIMLMAVAVLAIVGGALAFRTTESVPYGSCNIPQGLCNLNPVHLHFTTAGPTVFTTIAPVTQICTTTATIPGGADECTSFIRIRL
jgi:hypothetical protein